MVEQVNTKQDLPAVQTVRIFPNPASGQLNIILSEVHPRIGIRVENMKGQTLIRFEAFRTNKYQLDLHGLEPGWYLLKIDSGNEVITRKFYKY